MPANVVKTKDDEKKWEKAKELAAEQGHKEEYDYIMGIYKRMKPDYFKDKKSASDPMSHIRDLSDLPARVEDKARALPPAHQMAGGRGYFDGGGVSADINSATAIGKRIRLFNNTNILGVAPGQVRWGRAFVLHSNSFDAKGMARDLGLTLRRIDDERSIWLAYSTRDATKYSSLKNEVIRLAYENPELRRDLLPLVKEARSTLKVSVLDRDFQDLVDKAVTGAEFVGFSQASLNQLGFSAFLEVMIPTATMAGQDTETIFKKDKRAVQASLGKVFSKVREAGTKDAPSGYIVKYDVGHG